MKTRLVFACAGLALTTAFAQQQGTFPNRFGNGNRNRFSGINRPAATKPAAQAQGPTQEQKDAIKNAPKGTNGVPALVFNKTPVELVLEAYAEQLGKTVIPAPDLPAAQITLQSLEGQELSKDEYLEAIELVLTMNGVVLEPRGEKFLRALPRKTVRTHGTPVMMNAQGPLPEQGRVVSQMITIKNVPVAEAQKAIEGFKDPMGLFQVFERTNSILVTDTQENVNRMMEIIKMIDVPTPVLEDVFVRRIEFALATDIKAKLEEIVTESQKDNNKASGPKQSGAPGFSSNSRPQTSRLLNFNARPGVQQPQSAPNETLLAQVSDADRGMIRGKVLILADERSNKLIVVTEKTNMDFFDKVIKTLDVETTPEVSVEVLRLKYANAEDVASMINDLIGAAGNANDKNAKTKATGGGGAGNLTRNTVSPGAARSANPTFGGNSNLGELNKDNVKILADKRINGLVVMARKADMRALKAVIENMDVKLSQVLIETVIVQVELGDDLSTGIDWIKGRSGKGFTFADGDMMGGGGGSASATLKNFTGVGESMSDKISAMKAAGIDTSGMSASEIADLAAAFGTASANPIGGGISYFLKSKKLDISAIVQASKGDSRTKVLASPILMTVDNKEATIEATDMIYLFSGYQYSGSTYSGSQVRNYEKKDIGLTVKVTPRINPNGTVVLEVEQKFETQGADQNVPNESGGTDPYATVTTRKIQSDVSVENRQTVVMGGLTKKTQTDSSSGIPLLKDIPWVGKWLFGSVSQTEKRSELLVFMTPYVLDDAASAQLEAIRRKKALSDSRSWEDGGWSESAVADPVPQKERLRRLTQEWERQDEERVNRKAIEEAKFRRAEKLRQMNEQDRAEWLRTHPEEARALEKDAAAARDEQTALQEIVEGEKEKGRAETATVSAAPVAPVAVASPAESAK